MELLSSYQKSLSEYFNHIGHFCLKHSIEKTNLSVVAGKSIARRDEQKKLFEEFCELKPFEEKTFVFDYSHEKNTILQADMDTTDDLLSDNTAWVILPTENHITILLISKENFFLENVFRSIPGISLTRKESISYDNLVTLSKAYDIIIFDCITPPGIIKGNYILIQSFPKNLSIVPRGTRTMIPVTGWDQQHPVMKSVSPGDIQILNASKVIPGRKMRVLLQGPDIPLIAEFSSDTLRAVFFFFDLRQSDLILKPSFPILMYNTVMWLINGKTQTRVQAVKTGDMYEILVSPWIETLFVTTPHNTTTEYNNIDHPFIYEHTESIGIYEIKGDHFLHQFAINLANNEESDINSRFQYNNAEISETTSIAQGVTDYFNVWPYVILICIILLISEWFLWFTSKGKKIL